MTNRRWSENGTDDMTGPDYSGARGSNAGDDFHELWCLRQALTLLDPAANLKAMTLEGFTAEDETGASGAALDGVDCAMYYGKIEGGVTVRSATAVDIVQFKYSSANPETPWTIARLVHNKAAHKKNNSVVRRLADAFNWVKQQRGGSPKDIRVRLVSNQPESKELADLLASRGTAPDWAKVREATGLIEDEFQQFVSAFTLSKSESRLGLNEAVLQQVSRWTEGDSTHLRNRLLDFIHGKTLPESKKDPITRDGLLAALGFSDWRALFPCPPILPRTRNLILRQASAQVVERLARGDNKICIHGQAGCGKTTILCEIEKQLPPGSELVVYDCYGAGQYLDSQALRHREQDAYLQLSNELAVRLAAPLLLTRNEGTDYPRAFHHRLTRASDIVATRGDQALLVVAVDAADNSVAAALREDEKHFVQSFLALGGLPRNVRLIITTRTARLESLNLPSVFKRKEIQGFTAEDTACLVRSQIGDAPDAWIGDFHRLSFGNPRVQCYALARSDGQPGRALDYLLPSGKGLSRIFADQLREAGLKVGSEEVIGRLAAALSALPHPIPLAVLGKVTGLSSDQVKDICLDLVPGTHLMEQGVGFGDEDFEAHLRDAASVHLSLVRESAAESFMQNRASDRYAAAHLVTMLYEAKRYTDVLEIAQSEADPSAIADPTLKREVRLGRLRTAIRVCSESRDHASMLRVILAGADAMRGRDRLSVALRDFPDLAVAFSSDGLVREVLSNPDIYPQHGPLLFHLYRDRAFAGDRPGAWRAHQQLKAWLDRRRSEPANWSISLLDIAAEIEGVFAADGPHAAIRALRRWVPRPAQIEIVRIAVDRLIAAGRGHVLAQCLKDRLVPSPWDVLIIVPLGLAGRDVDLIAIERAVLQLARRGLLTFPGHSSAEDRSSRLFFLDTIVTAVEIYVAKGGDYARSFSALDGLIVDPFPEAQHLYPWAASVLDLRLRTRALQLRAAGKELTAADDRGSVDGGHHDRGHRDSPREPTSQPPINSLIRLYDTRAQILFNLGTNDPSVTLDEVPTPQGSPHSLSAWRDRDTRCVERAAVSLAKLCFDERISPEKLMAKCLAILDPSHDPLGSSEALVSVLRTFAGNEAFQRHLATSAASHATAIAAMQTLASQKISALLALARLLDPISRDEARAVFRLAHNAVDEMDVEGAHQLRALATLAIQGSAALDEKARRDKAAPLHSIATDCAVRLSDLDGYPWAILIKGLTALDPVVALASCSRWQDHDHLSLDRSLPAVLRQALAQGRISPGLATALLPLMETVHELLIKEVASNLKQSAPDLERAANEEIARDITLSVVPGTPVSKLESLREHLPTGADRPWRTHLEATLKFAARMSTDTPGAPFMGRKLSSKPPAPNDDAAYQDAYQSGRAIAETVEGELEGSRHSPDDSFGARYRLHAGEVLERIRTAVPLAGQVMYLRALVAAESREISVRATSTAVVKAITEWRTLAVEEWCRDELPEAIARLLPGFLDAIPLESDHNGPSVVQLLAQSEADIPGTLAAGISKNADRLDAATVYGLACSIIDHISPHDASIVFETYLKRIESQLPREHVDRLDIAHVPTDIEVAAARLLFALMSDCDVRIRWRAAHCVRRLARLGETGVLRQLLGEYDRQSETCFRRPDRMFRWMAGRLWWNMAVCRTAHECPNAVSPFGRKLFEIATDEGFPHVLIRAFARDGALTLAAGGFLSLSDQERENLDTVNSAAMRSRVPDLNEFGGQLGGYGRSSDHRFRFDWADTIPYWYEPARGVFADVSQEEFLHAAERWIVDKWRADSSVVAENHGRYTWNAFATRNDHGNLPLIEWTSTYLEWHAMFCCLGEFLGSRTPNALGLAVSDWIGGEGLKGPPLWLADRRRPIPLERRFWQDPAAAPETWAAQPVAVMDLLLEIGVLPVRGGMILVSGTYWTRYRQRSDSSADVHVSSALVEPRTASALARAFQSARSSSDYGIPFEGERYHEVNSGRFRLLGWLRSDEPRRDGIDRMDPLRRSVYGATIDPGDQAAVGLTSRLEPDGAYAWYDDNGAVHFLHEEWSNEPSYQGERQADVTTGGRRLWASTERVQQVLINSQLDLLVSVKTTRWGGRVPGDAGQEEPRVESARVFILRSNGDIEDATGSVGAWRTPGEAVWAP